MARLARTPRVTIAAALILAGSRPGAVDPVAAAAGVADKALVEIAGRSMLARVIDALRVAGVRRIVVAASSGAVATAARAMGCEVVAAARSGPSESVAAAFAMLGAPLLVTTADHALLDAGWVIDFVSDAPDDADVAALVARRDLVEAAVKSRRTWLRFADGDWSGCNLFWLATPRAAGAITLWRAVEADRKRPWRIVRRLGAGALLRYATGRLTLSDALALLGRRSGVRAAAVASRSGLAAVDVDKPDDLALVRRLVAERSAAP